jgi:hypothetical protein
VVKSPSQERPMMDCLKQQANCKVDVVRHAEDLKLAAGIVAHERRVMSARLAAASVGPGGLQCADRLQGEAVMVFPEKKDQAPIPVEGGTAVPERHLITTWLLVLIFAHSSVDSSKLLAVWKAAAE